MKRIRESLAFENWMFFSLQVISHLTASDFSLEQEVHHNFEFADNTRDFKLPMLIMVIKSLFCNNSRALVTDYHQ